MADSTSTGVRSLDRAPALIWALNLLGLALILGALALDNALWLGALVTLAASTYLSLRQGSYLLAGASALLVLLPLLLLAKAGFQ